MDNPKLTKPELEALQESAGEWGVPFGLRPKTMAKLQKQGLVCRQMNNLGRVKWRATDAGKSILAGFPHSDQT